MDERSVMLLWDQADVGGYASRPDQRKPAALGRERVGHAAALGRIPGVWMVAGLATAASRSPLVLREVGTEY